MKFASGMKSLEVFYQIISAPVMTKKFLKNGNLLSRRLKHISKMVMPGDGAVIIAARLGTMRLWKTRPIWKFSISSSKSTSKTEPIHHKLLTVFVSLVHSRLSRLGRARSFVKRHIYLIIWNIILYSYIILN